MIKTKHILIIFLLFFISSNIYSQTEQKIQFDKQKTEVRQSDKIQEFKNNPDFNYDEEEKEPNTLWQKILNWLFNLFLKIFSNEGAIPYIRNIIIVIVLVFVIIKLLNLNYQALFFRSRKSGKSGIDFETYDENIINEDLDKIINDSIQNQDYRKAVRFMYLKILKILNNNEIILWEKNKTNKDYRNELEKTKYNKTFNWLTFLYEYIWYGNFSISKNRFIKVKADFDKAYLNF